MAHYIDTHAAAGWSIKARFNAFLERLAEERRLARAVRQTYNELNSLSDRDLADLGIDRTDIARLARESVYGTN